LSATPDIAIIILAAGCSSRMGQAKQLLPWGHTTLIGHSIKQAVDSDARKIFVVLGANYDKIESAIKGLPIIIIKNKQWQQGMGTSISAAIKEIKSLPLEGTLFMLADQPQVDVELLNNLIISFKNSTKPIIATSYKNGAGVPAVFGKRYFEQLAQLSGDEGAKHLIANNRSDTKIIMPPNSLVDLDKMEDYTKLLKGL